MRARPADPRAPQRKAARPAPAPSAAPGRGGASASGGPQPPAAVPAARSAASAEMPVQVPHLLVAEEDAQFVRKAVSDRLAQALAQRPDMPLDERKQRSMMWINDEVATWYGRAAAERGEEPSGEEEQALAQHVFDLLWRAGRLQPLLDDPRWQNIHINRFDQVWGDPGGGGSLVRLPAVAGSDEELLQLLRALAAETSEGQQEKIFSPTAKPELAIRLHDGSRLQAFTGVTPYTCANIRKHQFLGTSLEQMLEIGTLDASLVHFLRAALKAKKNIMVSGKAGAGKTTLLRALLSEFGPDERIATLESEYELFAHEDERHRQIIAFEGREATSEQAGEYTLQDLIPGSLRMGVQRTVVGEVRGAEILAMMQALTSGEGGSLSTIHAQTPYGVFDRIAELYAMARTNLSEDLAYRQIRNGLHFVVHIERIDEREAGGGLHQFVSHVLEVAGGEGPGGRPATNTVFGPDPEAGEVRAVPQVQPECLVELLRAGMPPETLDRPRWMAPLPLKWTR